MSDVFDLTYLSYWITFVLILYNFIGFFMWCCISKPHKDRRFKMTCANVMALLLCFGYVLFLNIYARHLRAKDYEGYWQFLSSQHWAIRYLPIIVLLGHSAYRLTIWAINTWRIYQWKKKEGQPWNDRSY